jgi:hypothetical protein
MSTESDNRNIEVLFEDEMPGYRCIVTRQAEGAINLQFVSLSSHKTITLPAPAPDLWDSPEKLKTMCEQITGEFLMLCDETAAPSEGASQGTESLAEKLYAILHTLSNQKADH